MNKDQQIQLERRLILDKMNKIEDLAGKMFHEILPEIDTEFHESAYSDLIRLKAIRVNLEHYIDDILSHGEFYVRIR
jgi:hypothetical protein